MSDQDAGSRWFFANVAEVRLTSEATGGHISIVELCGPPGDTPPLHMHQNDDEAFYVFEGEMSFFVGTDQPAHRPAGSLGACLSNGSGT